MVEREAVLIYAHTLSPVFGLIANVMFQLVLCRYVKNLRLLRSVFLGFLCGFVLLLSGEIVCAHAMDLSIMDAVGQITVSNISYAALGYCYFHFVNLGETARRVRIVRELYDSKAGLSMEEILERYNAKSIVGMRISRLVNNGQVIYRNGGYYIGKLTVLLMAKIIVGMKLIILGKKSEFD